MSEQDSMNIWDTEIRVGDFIRVEVVNKKGDRNLDGAWLTGTVKDLVPSHKMVRLNTGWCCHSKDRLLIHKPAAIIQAEGAEALEAGE